MNRIARSVMAVILLGICAVAQQSTTALPNSRSRLGGNDPSQRIARETLHELLMQPYYSVFDNLGFQVQGRDVTLTGQVVNPALKSDAEASVKHIEGVEHVTDNIEVLPPSPMDDQIRRAEYRAIYSWPSLSKYSWGAVPTIHIIVKGGHVTLIGAVDNQSDKDAANVRANSVSGVFSVTNDLMVVNNEAKK